MRDGARQRRLHLARGDHESQSLSWRRRDDQCAGELAPLQTHHCPTGANDETTGDLNITNTLTIAGAGAASAIIDGNAIDRVFKIGTSGVVTITDVTIRNGLTAGVGGGIYLFQGTLTLNNSTLNGNSAYHGGGMFASVFTTSTLNNVTVNGNSASVAGGGITHDPEGDLIINNSFITGNSAGDRGGGIEGGVITLNNSVIAGNSAANDGGGINTFRNITLNNSTVNANGAGRRGGGISVELGGNVTLNNSTISANGARGNGGGIYHVGTVRLFHVTVAGNVADRDFMGAGSGGGIYRAAGGSPNELWNTMLVENFAANQANDCAGNPMTSQDYNYIQTTAVCAITGTTTHNLTGGDALLAVLQDNGGATPTRALLIGSPAIDQIPPALCRDSFGAAPTIDQRGVQRPVGPLCDIGAYEGSVPTPLYNRNLIRNSDAENGGGSPTGGFVGTPNWTVTDGQFTAVPYNSPGGFPNTATDVVPANHGYNFFAGGNAALAVANQVINVSMISADIDASRVKYALSADLGGFQDQDDSALLLASFLDGASMPIANPVQIGPVTAADRGNATGFRNRSENGVVPSGTRTIRVQVQMILVSGPYNDGYADNLSLVLTTGKLFLPLILR